MRRCTAILGVLALLFSVRSAVADPPAITTTRAIRDHRTVNSVGFTPGDRIYVGANQVSPADGTECTATQGGTTIRLLRRNVTTKPDLFMRSVPYDASLTGDWTLECTNGGDTTTAQITGIGTVSLMPLVQNVRTVGRIDTTPQFEWDPPPGYPIDAFPDDIRIRIWDREDFREDGQANQIHRESLAPTATTFTVPATLSEGGSLEEGHLYTISIDLVKERGAGSTQPLSRSRFFFDFSPVTDTPFPGVPEISPTNFEVTEGNPNNVTFFANGSTRVSIEAPAIAPSNAVQSLPGVIVAEAGKFLEFDYEWEQTRSSDSASIWLFVDRGNSIENIDLFRTNGAFAEPPRGRVSIDLGEYAGDSTWVQFRVDSADPKVVGPRSTLSISHLELTPDAHDPDGDAIPSSWERYGYTRDGVFVDLPGLGADPLHKDVFVYVDYMRTDEFDFRPADLTEIVTAFANAPLMNPDGATGINLHVWVDPDPSLIGERAPHSGSTGVTPILKSSGGVLTYDADTGAFTANDSAFILEDVDLTGLGIDDPFTSAHGQMTLSAVIDKKGVVQSGSFNWTGGLQDVGINGSIDASVTRVGWTMSGDSVVSIEFVLRPTVISPSFQNLGFNQGLALAYRTRPSQAAHFAGGNPFTASFTNLPPSSPPGELFHAFTGHRTVAGGTQVAGSTTEELVVDRTEDPPTTVEVPVLGDAAANGTYKWKRDDGETSATVYFDDIKLGNAGLGIRRHFPPELTGAARYCIFANVLGGVSPKPSGLARAPDTGEASSDFIVSLGTFLDYGLESDPPRIPPIEWQKGTFMHELGHVLGLDHGGGNTTPFKPNYLSVMNYSFQKGLSRDGNNNVYDFSRIHLPALDENHLNEQIGLGKWREALTGFKTTWYKGIVNPGDDVSADRQGWTTAFAPASVFRVDWNLDDNDPVNDPQSDASSSINGDVGKSTPLAGYHDWARLDFRGGTVGAGAPAPENLPASTAVAELTVEGARTLVPPPVEGLAARAGRGSVRLAWNPGGYAGDVSYRVFRKVAGAAGNPALAGETTATLFVDRGLARGTTYEYTVRLVGSLGAASAPSKPVTVLVR